MPRLEAVSTNIIRRIGVIQTGTGTGLTPEEKERIGLEIFEPGQESRPDSLAGRLHQLEKELDRIERERGDQGQALSEIIDNLDKIAQEIALAREGRPSLFDNIKDIRDLINSLPKQEWLSFENRESFTAIAGQTEFVLTKFTYEPGSGHLWVFRNGVLQSPGEDRDYVEIDESTIQFNEPLEEGELITCVLFGKTGSGQQPGSSGGSLSDDLLIQNTINLAKTNFKLNAHIAATRERLSGLIIDVFTDTSGIDEELSRGWKYDPERKEIHVLRDHELTNLVWEERFTTNAPPARNRHSLTYDSTRGVVVLFGGAGGLFSDTWEYDGTDWREINTPTKPSVRYGHSLAYDSTRGVVVLFGGTSGSPYANLSETWEYDGNDWRQINTPTKPRGRYGHSLAYDTARGVVVLFGGYNAAESSHFNDTWEYDGTDWRQINTPTKPQAREQHSLTYDSARGVVVLFGGFNGSSRFNDTWEYDGSNWRKINTPTQPPARYGHSLTYDAARGVVVLFGGYDGSRRLNDIWEYDGTDWRQINTPTKPPARSGHSLTYDSARGVVVLFGGQGDGDIRLNDTWEYWDNTDPAEVVSSADILDSRPSYIYFVSHTPEDVSDASIQYQMSLDDGETWFSVSPEELIQVKSNINSSDPPIIRAKAIISAGGRLSGWAYGWV